MSYSKTKINHALSLFDRKVNAELLNPAIASGKGAKNALCKALKEECKKKEQEVKRKLKSTPFFKSHKNLVDKVRVEVVTDCYNLVPDGYVLVNPATGEPSDRHNSILISAKEAKKLRKANGVRLEMEEWMLFNDGEVDIDSFVKKATG